MQETICLLEDAREPTPAASAHNPSASCKSGRLAVTESSQTIIMDGELARIINEHDDEKKFLLGQTSGLSVFMATVFLVGEMAGSGVLALPDAIEATGWIGLVLIPLCGLVSGYTGDILGQCWEIVKERYPDMKGHVRYPYPAIGMKTFGLPGSINFTLFGVSCVFLLLAAQNMHTVFADNHAVDLSLCYWIMIFMALLIPLSLFGSPKDFKWVALGASAATSLACVILVVLMILDHNKHPDRTVIHSKINPLDFAAAFGTICFAFGGHPTFPTFQNDMREPRKFGRVCIFAYLVMVLLYFPVAAGGYFVYGKNLKDNVLLSVSPGIVLSIIQCLITVHLVCSYIIVINPLCQELEELFKVPLNFNYKRVVLRVFLCGLVLFTTEAVPRFGAILSLIGGSTTALLAYIAPPIFYIKLSRMEGEWPKIDVSLTKLVALGEIGLVGALAGAFATYSAIKALASPDALSLPCFINITAASG